MIKRISIGLMISVVSVFLGVSIGYCQEEQKIYKDADSIFSAKVLSTKSLAFQKRLLWLGGEVEIKEAQVQINRVIKGSMSDGDSITISYTKIHTLFTKVAYHLIETLSARENGIILFTRKNKDGRFQYLGDRPVIELENIIEKIKK